MKTVLLFFLLTFLNAQTVTITGVVIQKETGVPLQGVNIRWGDTGTATDREGQFSLSGNRSDSLIVSHIGYKTVRLHRIKSPLTIRLTPIVLESPVIEVEAVRAVDGITPVTFSTLTPEEIRLHYSVQDVPMVLATEPGVYAYSESGNGTGYSYVSIRGFDQSRISVMIDNVPLNDNESFQVYWVDHGDILAQAEDVQIQRGLGLGIIGSSSFGGSINLRTGVRTDEEKTTVTFGGGTYKTTKTRFQYSSGKRFGEKNAFGVRVSQVESAGYRKFHDSFQRTGFLGYDRYGDRWTHRFRAIVGKEITRLSWDGIPSWNIHNRELRRAGNRAYTDDFLQFIVSLNSALKISPNFRFRNTIYQVKGKGFYRVRKSGVDYYSYNLDWDDQIVDSLESDYATDLTRRKWIVNQYSGWNPSVTWMKEWLRFDAGIEYRYYRGNHFGEVNNFSDDSLQIHFGTTGFRYYNYTGEKTIFNKYAQLGLRPVSGLWIFISGQYQSIAWRLNQQAIGHAGGYRLNTDWTFLNPRFGLSYRLTDSQRIFLNYGVSRKEPADNQIIEADDVFSKPKNRVAPEMITGREAGYQFRSGGVTVKLNAYIINYTNEQLKQIDINQEGEYEYYSAPKTRHQGLELEASWLVVPRLLITVNGTLGKFRYRSGAARGQRIPNIPETLGNGVFTFRPGPGAEIALTLRYVGEQTLDENGRGKNPAFFLMDLTGRFSRGPVTLSWSLNNLLNSLYTTYGYDYEWEGLQTVFWPGATRNGMVELSLSL